MPNPNLELLELAAEQLRPLLSEIVFVGGCATGLLIDDPAAAPVRGTYDVDVILRLVHTLNTLCSLNGFALWDSAKIRTKARHYAAGPTAL